MSRSSIRFALLSACAAGLVGFRFGGWATVTVDDLPASITVSQPTKIGFFVRQHGHTPLSDLGPSVVATSGSSEFKFNALPSGAAGHYEANVTLPKKGYWTLELRSGFGNSNFKLLPVPVIAPGARPPAEAPAETGRRLYVAKGCVSCHVRDGVDRPWTFEVGPNLTPKRYEPQFLARFLADPSIQRTPGAQAQMPNLGLKQTEIASLVAFLNSK